MSFSSELKGELARITPEKKCCMLAEITGFFRTSGSLRLVGGGQFTIVAATENPAIARHYKQLIKQYFGSTAKLEVSDSQLPGRAQGRHHYALTIRPEEKSGQILRETGMLLIREGEDYLSDGVYFPVLRTKCCRRAYLRGAFLGCGSITDPRRSYHMEFVLRSEAMARDLRRLIAMFEDLSAQVAQRREDHVVYLKRAEYISDMLGIMGAGTAVMAFENIRIERGLRREVNRMANCDNANVDRALSAAAAQLDCIGRIERRIGLGALEPSLREVARLRLARPDANLTELGEALQPPVRKAAVSKRFARLREIADRLDG